MGNVQISPNLKRIKESIDINGNKVVPFTKQVTEFANANDYVPTPEELKAITQPRQETIPEIVEKENKVIQVSGSPLDIQAQIDQAKENLAKLEELKKLKIAEMKAQLELLEK